MGLWKVVADVAKLTDGECVFIGGVAVYLYTHCHEHRARRAT
jgi:hypothetical protein